MKKSVYEQIRSDILQGNWNVFKILEEVEKNTISNSESYHLQSMIASEQRKQKINKYYNS